MVCLAGSTPRSPGEPGETSLAKLRDAPAMRVTDVHVHIQPWEQLTPASLAFIQAGHPHDRDRIQGYLKDPGAFLRYMDAQGVQRCGLINYVAPDTLGFTEKVNDFVSAYVRDHPDRLIAYGGVHPRLGGDAADAKRKVRALQQMGIRALKIHPSHQLVHANDHVRGNARLGAIYETAQELGMPVMVHTGTSMFPSARNRFGHPLELDDVCADYPDLKVIMAHGGRPLWTDEAFFVMRRFDNVWLDVSSIPPKRFPEWFPKLTDVISQVLYGSDWPGPGPKELGDNVRVYREEMGLPRPLVEMLMHENSLALFPEAA